MNVITFLNPVKMFTKGSLIRNMNYSSRKINNAKLVSVFRLLIICISSGELSYCLLREGKEITCIV